MKKVYVAPAVEDLGSLLDETQAFGIVIPGILDDTSGGSGGGGGSFS